MLAGQPPGCPRCSSLDALAIRPFLPAPAAGVSLAANAVFDHLLGDRLRSLQGGIGGVVLVFAGVTLCTLAQQEQVQ